MTVKWIPGPFLAIFMGATWIKQGYMIAMLPVRGSFSIGDGVEVIWPGADPIALKIKAANTESNYRPATIERAQRAGIPLRSTIIVEDPSDARLAIRRGHFLAIPEDAAHFPDAMRDWVQLAPPGVLLAAPGTLDAAKIKALPAPAARDYHNIVRLVEEGVL